MVMDNVMIDLETWGKSPHCVVTQVAAVQFDPVTGEIGAVFDKNIQAKTEMDNGFPVDASTLYWWFDQSSDAQRAAFGHKADRNQSKYVWVGLNMFLQKIKAKNVWCHATWDWPIVMDHFSHYSINSAVPYYAVRDLRSAVLLGGIDIRSYKKDSLLHSGVEDCKVQIKYLKDALERIGVCRLDDKREESHDTK